MRRTASEAWYWWDGRGSDPVTGAVSTVSQLTSGFCSWSGARSEGRSALAKASSRA